MCEKVCAYLFLCSLFLLVNCVDIQKREPPSDKFVLVRPVVRHGRSKRELSTTRHESGVHQDEVLVTIAVQGEPYELVLKLNYELLPEGHVISYEEEGKTVLYRPNKEEIDLCQYSGYIRGRPNSWVALSTCQGLRGVINDGTKIRFIEPSEGSDVQSLHYVYEKNEHNKESRCGNHDFEILKDLVYKNTHNNSTKKGRHKRESYLTKGGPYKSNEKSRYVELVIVADYGQYLGAGRNLRKLHHQLQETTNIVNAYYAPLNIFVALTGVEVWTTGDRIPLSEDSSTTLSKFMEYRRSSLLSHIPNDHAQLITRKKFLSGVVGKAYVSKMCTYELSGAIIHQPGYKASADLIASTANIMAHEMGHSFGMSHDQEGYGCKDMFCIMYASTVSYFKPSHFSNVNLREMQEGFSRGRDYCLRNKPASLFGSPSCGNGFLDPGEQCDCGVAVEGLERSGCEVCCHPETCQLRTNATCAMGACCDLQKCQLKPVSTLCRSAGECDLPEYCTGDSEICPEDVFKMDTTPCSEQSYCIQGKCRSRDKQCRLLWGSSGRNGRSDCYDNNLKSDWVGNCGYDILKKRQVTCSRVDAPCGRLHCRHLNGLSEFGDTALQMKYYSQSYLTGEITFCAAIRIDFGVSNVDPGLVPDGVSCGAGQMCLKQRCVSVSDERRRITQHHSKGCLTNCSGHGICNSKGHCHCDDGFAPPMCDEPGPGGSDDSGPARDPRVLKNFKVVMYIIFLGVIPLIASMLLLICFIKCQRHRQSEQGQQNSQSLSTSTTMKIHSLFGKIIGNSKTNTLTDVNKNMKPETVNEITKYDIQIAHGTKIEPPQSAFDEMSYVNYKNEMQECKSNLSSNLVPCDKAKASPRHFTKDNNNGIATHNHLAAEMNMTNKEVTDTKVEPRPPIAPKQLNVTTPSNALSAKHIPADRNNFFNNIKQKAEARNTKTESTLKNRDYVKPMVTPKLNQSYPKTAEEANKNVLYSVLDTRTKLKHVKNSPLSKDSKLNTSSALFEDTDVPKEVSNVQSIKNKFEQNS